MALLVDAANQVLTLDNGADQKGLAPIINPRVRRRERQGAGLKAAAAATAAVKTQAKSAFAKTAPAAASAKVKEESKPAQPVQETAEKGSSGPAKKAAPPLKRGASSGIMQAFSKAASKPAKVKKEAETPSPAEPTNMQALSDDGEDDEELPQPKPRSSSGFKSKKQREEELRRMMEEEDEEENQASEKEDTPEEEEPMEEEPPAPEPVKEEETEVVTASANGRRRGKRRVMRKKQIMDDQGYLGTLMASTLASVMTLTLHHSHNSGARLGVLLRGRGSPADQAQDNEFGCPSTGCKAKEGRPERSGQYHVFLLQEVTAFLET
jgi:DNA polymerase delta subunit 3